MNSVAKEFEDSFERFKNESAHRIRCLVDTTGDVGLKIVRDTELLGLSYNHNQRQAHHMLALTSKIKAIMDKKNTANVVLISMTISK